MAPQVLFIYNEHLATEGLLGEAFTECGYDVATFEVARWSGWTTPPATWRFPIRPTYDVIVPLGARWPVYDEALRQTWVGAEMQMLRDAADAGVPTLGVCFGGQLLAQAFGGSVTRSTRPEIGWYDVASDDESLIPGGRWFEWHFDTSTAAGATEIMRTANASQAFVLGRALGCNSTPRSITICSTLARRRPQWRGRQRRPHPRRIAFGDKRNRERRGPPHPRSGTRFSIACRPSAVSELMRQRVGNGRVPEPCPARSASSAPPADRPRRVRGRPDRPTTAAVRTTAQATGAGRCSTPASVFVYSMLRTGSGPTALTGPAQPGVVKRGSRCRAGRRGRSTTAIACRCPDRPPSPARNSGRSSRSVPPAAA